MTSDGKNFNDVIAFEHMNEAYITNISLPVGSSFTADVCAGTSVGLRQCTMLNEMTSTRSPPPPSKSMYTFMTQLY